ncbi:hypothetical protein HK099_005669 [Clydaea vesicula]|uniref:Peptidase M12B domain-containing protein n=1 Tax=Clydaea vesicula TaxID=447962 RepID=A0AAD5TYZ6_9FUNG|nr:hypothetical protein HK099_005669 [Clydaea vesicula]KAJ3380269.1 hypothetical protein HDU92_006078 [Lobulomyces angularis]
MFQILLVLVTLTLINSKLVTNTFLNHFDIVNSHLNKRSLDSDFKLNLHYRQVPLEITLQPKKNLLSKRLQDELLTSNLEYSYEEKFFSGSIKNVPNSYVSLTKIGSNFQGILNFGDLNFGPLFLETSEKFEDLKDSDTTIVYSINDINDNQFKRRIKMRFEKRQDSPLFNGAELSLEQLYEVVSGVVKEALVSPITSNPEEPLADFGSEPTAEVPVEEPTEEQPDEQQPEEPIEIPIEEPVETPVEPEQPIEEPEQPIEEPEQPIEEPEQPVQPEEVPRQGPSCKAAVIADFSFFQNHKDEPEGIETFILSLMNEVSGFYENQLGIPFSVDFIFASKNQNENSELNNLPTDPESVVPAVNRAAEELNGLDTKDFCVVAVLTSTEFQNSAVGVSFVGTVCSPNKNTAVITDTSGTMPRAQLLSVLMHEIGHLFGANHDENQCVPQNKDERFVMFPVIQPDSVNTFRFSPCSVEEIQNNLNSIDTCFNNEKASGGGNGNNRIAAGFGDETLLSEEVFAPIFDYLE